MKCQSNIGPCCGMMIFRSKFVPAQVTNALENKKFPHRETLTPEDLVTVYPQGSLWIAAHDLPIFLQCSECGFAPLPADQPALIKRALEERLEERALEEVSLEEIK